MTDNLFPSNTHLKTISTDTFVHTISCSSSVPPRSISSAESRRIGLNSIEKDDEYNQLETLPKFLKSTQGAIARTSPNVYQDLVFRHSTSEPLIQQFIDENKSTRASDANSVDFSLNSCLNRLKNPFKIYLFSYSQAKIQEIHMRIHSNGIKIINGPFYNISNFAGVLIGESSTIKRKNFAGIDTVDCVSIIGKFHSLNLWTRSSTLRYDILIVISWLISVSSPISTTLAFTKAKLTVITARLKIRKEAQSRYLSVTELFLLSMIRYLRYNKDPRESLILNILNRRFTLAHQFCKTIKCFINSSAYRKQKNNQQCYKRINALNDKRLERLAKQNIGRVKVEFQNSCYASIKDYFLKRKQIK